MTANEAANERDALRETAERYRRLIEHAPVGIYVHDGTTILYANQAIATMLGAQTPKEVEGLALAEIVPEAIRAAVRERAERLLSGAEVNPLFLGGVKRRDGGTVAVEIMATRCLFRGTPAIQVIAIDVTRRLEAEAAVRERDAVLLAIYEGTAGAVLLFDVEGPGRFLVREANPFALSIAQLPREALVGRVIEAGAHPDAAAVVEHLVRVVRENRPLTDELLVPLASGPSWFMSTLSPIRGATGKVERIVAVAIPIDDRKRMQRRLAAAERMASIGTLAAGVAHEINNPLAFVTGNLEAATHQLAQLVEQVRRTSPAATTDALREVQAALLDAEEGARRVQRIVQDLKTFSRTDDETAVPVDLGAVVSSSIHLAHSDLTHRARLQTDLQKAPPVLGTEARLGQVIVNLLSNAAHAIEDGAVARNTISVKLHPAPEDKVVLEISDTGCGIPADVLPHVFEPFFTTKAVGRGTGLGLSICHGIVTGLGGEIRVESKDGQGTTVRVVLPAWKAKAPVRHAPVEPAVPARARILVVDDEPRLGSALERMLSPRHEVTIVTSGREAIDRLAPGEAFDVVLCDLMMPDVDGMAVYAWVTAQRPDLTKRIVFMTGGAFTQRASDFLSRVEPLQLLKPFRTAEVESIIEQVQQRNA